MVLQEFLDRLGKLEVLSSVSAEGFADRFNYLYSAWLLLMMCSITTVKTYFMAPITCYIPNIVGSHEGQAAYVMNFCYSEGTYNVAPDEFKIDNSNPHWMDAYKDRKIYYYQWLPLVLGLQGVFCFMPHFLWLIGTDSRTGLDAAQAVKAANDVAKSDSDRREKAAKAAAGTLLTLLNNGRRRRWNEPLRIATPRDLGSCLLSCPHTRGSRLLLGYFAIKFLYIANACLQLVMMAQLLQLEDLPGNRQRSYFVVTVGFGFKLLLDLLTGQDWQNTRAFPRSGCCAIQTRQAAGTNFVFAQCSLPVNMLHEKVYIVLWFWFCILFIVSVVSFFRWLVMMLPCRREKQVKELLMAEIFTFGYRDDLESDRKVDAEDLRVFVDYLQYDGFFLLTMMIENCGYIVGAEVCKEVFKVFSREQEKRTRKADLKPNGEGGSRRHPSEAQSVFVADEKVPLVHPTAPNAEDDEEPKPSLNKQASICGSMSSVVSSRTRLKRLPQVQKTTAA